MDGLLKVSMKSIGESKRDRSGEELWTAIKDLTHSLNDPLAKVDRNDRKLHFTLLFG